MAIVMITIIAIETIIGAKPNHAVGILGYGANSLSATKGGVDESLRMERYGYNEHNYRHTHSACSCSCFIHGCKITHYS